MRLNGDDSERTGIPVQSISVPKGGGALTSVGELFEVDDFTGAVTLTIPLPTASARGFEPQLALSYTSRGGNGPFGLGVGLSLASIQRLTSRGVPRYSDADSFIATGYGEMVPLAGGRRTAVIDGVEYAVRSFAPRLQSSFDLIEHWEAIITGDNFWRILDQHNVTSILGRTSKSRISDPDDSTHVFAWLLDTMFDSLGNLVTADYLPEDTNGVADAIYERNRTRTANRYSHAVRFGNARPYSPPPFGVGPAPRDEFHFELIFDYGEYDPSPRNDNPYVPARTWLARPDPFSSYSAGFEIRTHRLCRNVLLFHRFEELGPEPVINQCLRFIYDEDQTASRLIRVDSVGYSFDATQPPGHRYKVSALPPLEFTYVPFEPQAQSFEPVLDTFGQPLISLDQVPSVTLVDLEGSGVPGILYADGLSVFYRSPAAPGGLPARFEPQVERDVFPVPRTADAFDVRLIDLDGDGRLELLVSDPRSPGFYSNKANGNWEEFRSFNEWPLDFGASGQALADLSGTGRADLVRINASEIQYNPSRGEAGFASPVTLPNTYRVPSPTGPLERQLTVLGDVLGSGIQVIRASSGRVECWPSLGYGRFGPRIELGNAPRFEDQDAAMLFLADLSGTGEADLISVDGAKLRVWFNRSGNSFSEPFEVRLPIEVTSRSQVSFADLGGTGITSLIVMTDGIQLKAWSFNLAGGRRPHMLSSIRNNLGAETKIEYASSTSFYLRDRQEGLEWITSLPFPIQVAAAVQHHDLISETRTRKTYRYHHGYFDPVAREFRGFGMTEHQDAEDDEEARRGVESERVRDAGNAPPALTKTWRHTGAWIEGNSLEAQYSREYFTGDHASYRMPDCVFDSGRFSRNARAMRQAATSLAGSVLRTEIYGLDVSPHEEIPYQVSESNFLVRMEQPPSENYFGVFSVNLRENLETDYERVVDDPRINHDLLISVDRFGNETLSCSIAYPRRAGRPDTFPAQRELHVTAGSTDYIEEPGEAVRILGLPFQIQSFEVLGLDPAENGYFDFNSVATAVRDAIQGHGGTVSARRIGWSCYYYYGANGEEAPLGQTGPQQLRRRSQNAFSEKSGIETLFNGILTPAEIEFHLSNRGHFSFNNDDGYWWAPSSVTTFSDASSFFLPSAIIDPIGSESSYGYDGHRLFVFEIVNRAIGVLDHRVFVDAFDYLKLLPLRTVGINDNVNEVQVDPLGKVFLTSRYGTEGDEAVGFESIIGVNWPEPNDATDVLAEPEKFVGKAESFYYYDLFSFMGRVSPAAFQHLKVDVNALWTALSAIGIITSEGAILEAFRRISGPEGFYLPAEFSSVRDAVFQSLLSTPHGLPVNWILLQAQEYSSEKNASAPPQIIIGYCDGYGRRLQTKRKAEPGPAFIGDANGRLVERNGCPIEEYSIERWITSGRVRYNNKGLACKVYKPYFSASSRLADDQALEQSLVATTLSYDAIDKLARIDLPSGFFWRFERTAWRETRFDPSDTVIDSDYYREHVRDGTPIGLDKFAGEALLKSALAAGTPTTSVFDNLTRAIAVITENNPGADAAYFEPIGLSNQQATALVEFLQAAGFIDLRGALTIGFQPVRPDFNLELPQEFQQFEPQILARMKNLQNRGVRQVTQYGYDIQGNQIWAVDPRLLAGSLPGIKNYERSFSIDGTLLKNASADAGTRYTLPDYRGELIFERDANSTILERDFDTLGRLSAVRVKTAVGEWTAQRWVYGDTLDDGQQVVADPKKMNLMDAVYRVFDQAGLTQFDLYSLTGGPMIERRQFTLNYRTPSDWLSPDINQIIGLLDQSLYETKTQYDALGRVRVETDAVLNQHRTEYLISGEPGRAALVDDSGVETLFVESASYDADGNPVEVAHGNQVVSTYVYDPFTKYLTGLRAVHRDSGTVLQELTAYRDAVGNITHLTDRAFAGLFGPQNNAGPGADFDYDALYRVIAVRSQEHAFRGAERDRQGGYEGLAIAYNGGAIDPDALAGYQRSFAYDSAGNRYAVLHTGSESEWMTELVVSDSSNRSVEAEIFGEASSPAVYPVERTAPAAEIDKFFDPNGNQSVMLGIDRLDADYRNQTAHVAIDCDAIEEFYLYGSDGMRARRVIVTPSGRSEILYLGSVQIERSLSASGPPVEVRRRIDASFDSLFVAQRVRDASNSDRMIYSLSNPLRSVALQLTDDGSLLTYEEYLPYGGTSFAVVSDEAVLALKQTRYSQEERDRSTGLYYYGARYLVAWSGRWSSPDPAGPIEWLNLFQFVEDSPTTAIDIGGAVRLNTGAQNVDITPAEILKAVHDASAQLQTKFAASPLNPDPVKEKHFNVYMPRVQGDLLKLGFQEAGDPLRNRDAQNYRLVFGTIPATLHQMGSEKGVHNLTIRNLTGMAGKKPDYLRMNSATPTTEARRLIRLLKVKELPTDTAYNTMMPPVMAISETDRSRIGGLLAMIELYNVKYGSHSFAEGFHGKTPYFIGAKKGGGARALKALDYAIATDNPPVHPNITGPQRQKLEASLEAFVSKLNTNRGKITTSSKFTGLTTMQQVQAKITQILVKRAGPAPAPSIVSAPLSSGSSSAPSVSIGSSSTTVSGTMTSTTSTTTSSTPFSTVPTTTSSSSTSSGPTAMVIATSTPRVFRRKSYLITSSAPSSVTTTISRYPKRHKTG